MPDSVSTTPSQNLPPDRPGMRRAALAMVIIMSALLVVALIAVVWGFVRQSHILMATRAARTAQASAAMPAKTGNTPQMILTLAPGVRIISAQVADGRLVMHLTGPAGDEVQLIDLATGAPVTQVRTTPSP